MILSNVNIGTGAGTNDGDSIRTAFNIVNNNFTQIQGNVNTLESNASSVRSVAGRTGNITLTINDIVGYQGLNLSTDSAPTHSNSSGTKGQVIVSGGTLYICTAANTWVKTSVTTSF